MAEENPTPPGWPPKPPSQVDAGAGSAPRVGETPFSTPSFPKVDARTMSSDLKSIQESGGGAPKPYTPSSVSPTPTPPTPPTIPTPKPQEPAFRPVVPEAKTIPFIEQAAQMPPSAPKEPPFVAAKKPKKGLFALLLLVILVIGLGAIGYFFIYPVFFKASAPPPEEAATTGPTEPETPAPQTPTPQTPTTTGAEATPSILPEVSVPLATTTVETAVPEAVPEKEQAPAAPSITHASLLKTKADLTSDITLSSLSVAALREAIKFAEAEVPVLKEVVIKDSAKNVLSFSQIISFIAPDVFTSEVINSFEADPTLVAYTDSKGTWLSFVTKLKADAKLDEVKSKVSGLEQSTGLSNFFLSDPGTGQAWRPGQAEGVNTRYITFSQSGAGLNYGWLNSNLVISSSYAAFKETVKRLK